jgi:3-oxoacyl-[acyl-carrier protein] reductase
MDLGISGRVALVTASSKGLGQASALALAEEGCKVVVCARGEEALRATEKQLAERTEVMALVEDVTEPDAPRRLVQATVDRFGTIDILVPNAGGPPPTRAFEFDDQQLATALNANLTTSIRLVREAVPHMRLNKWGRICCITSYSLKQPLPTLALSNVSRTALWAWIKTAAQDVFSDGITINTAAPGSHATDRIKALGGGNIDGAGDPADFGRVVAFLCSQPANFITAAALQVDGGATTGLL